MCTLTCQCHTYQTTEGSFSLRSMLDETCGHVVSILFKAQAAVMMGLHQTSVTSSTRTWNNKFKKRAHAERISSMLTLSGRHTKWRTVPTGPAALCVEKLQKIEEVVEFWAVQGCAFMTCGWNWQHGTEIIRTALRDHENIVARVLWALPGVCYVAIKSYFMSSLLWWLWYQ